MTDPAVASAPGARPTVPTTYRCRQVRWSGVACLALGLAVPGLDWWRVLSVAHRSTGATASAGVISGGGLCLALLGVGFFGSSVTIDATTLTSRWLFSTTAYRLDALVDATLATPRSNSDATNGLRDWLRGPVIMLAIAAVRLVSMTLRWILIPGSTMDQVLHVIPLRGGGGGGGGGAIPLRSISTRTRHPGGDAAVALRAVKRAIGPPGSARSRETEPEPTQWSTEIPHFVDWRWGATVAGATGRPVPGRPGARS